MVDPVARQKAVNENYQAFSLLLPELMKSHAGEFVVMHDKEPVKYFNTLREAMVYGAGAYEDGVFSVQEITQKTIDLGWFSHAPVHGSVRSC